MTRLRTFAMRIRSLFAKRRLDREFDEELQSHFDMLVEQNLQRGMGPDAARCTARQQLGGAEQIKEAVRDQHGLPFLESLWQDVRYGARMLRKSPGFTIVAVLTLALGIGVNTAIFSIVNAVLLRPLPYKDADRIVYLSGVAIDTENFRDWKQQSKSYDLFGAVSLDTAELTGNGEAQRLQTSEVSQDYFPLGGIQPALGRELVQANFQPGSGRVAVMSNHQSRILGTTRIYSECSADWC
jgi:MacB-like periplasmic core domain